MIKKLRKNIIIVNMLLVGTVIMLIFATICFNSYSTSISNIEHGLNQAIDKNEDDFQPSNKIGGKDHRDNPMFLNSYVVVAVDESGNILNSYENNATIDDDDLAIAVSSALNDKKSNGEIGDLKLMYVQKDVMGRTKIAFADTRTVYASLWNTILICSGLCIGSLFVIFLISLALSGLAVKPVKKAWTQQKQFVADASHELKTPLTVILANNNIMMSHKNATIKDEQQWLDSTDAEAQHMKKLIDQMLFLAKSDAGQQNTEFEEINISDIVEGTLLNFEPVAYEKNVEIQSDIQQNIKMMSNSVLMTQIAHILIDNAVKYSSESTVINVNLKLNGDELVFDVNNKGNVISVEDLPHLFDRFYRADKARTTGGYGLGLSIAQNITTTLGGKISAESNSTNGTTFTVVISKKKHLKNVSDDHRSSLRI